MLLYPYNLMLEPFFHAVSFTYFSECVLFHHLCCGYIFSMIHLDIPKQISGQIRMRGLKKNFGSCKIFWQLYAQMALFTISHIAQL
jgi:hypothetical protein